MHSIFWPRGHGLISTLSAFRLRRNAPNTSPPPVTSRAAWHGTTGSAPRGADDRLDVHHAWQVEDLPGGRARVLAQETQRGTPALALAATKPDPMINYHPDWLGGLIAAARAKIPHAA